MYKAFLDVTVTLQDLLVTSARPHFARSSLVPLDTVFSASSSRARGSYHCRQRRSENAGRSPRGSSDGAIRIEEPGSSVFPIMKSCACRSMKRTGHGVRSITSKPGRSAGENIFEQIHFAKCAGLRIARGVNPRALSTIRDHIKETSTSSSTGVIGKACAFTTTINGSSKSSARPTQRRAKTDGR